MKPEDSGEERYLSLSWFRWFASGAITGIAIAFAYAGTIDSRLRGVEQKQTEQGEKMNQLVATQQSLTQAVLPEVKGVGERLTKLNEDILKQRAADLEARLKEFQERATKR